MAGFRDDAFCMPARPRSAARCCLRDLAAGAQQIAPRISTTDLGGATLLQGAGCNVIAMPGTDGALMIDGGLAANADALLAAVRNATRQQSHPHADQHALASRADRRQRSGWSQRRRHLRPREDADVPEQHRLLGDVHRPPARLCPKLPDRTRPRAVTARWSSPASRSTTATCPRPTPTGISTSIFRR